MFPTVAASCCTSNVRADVRVGRYILWFTFCRKHSYHAFSILVVGHFYGLLMVCSSVQQSIKGLPVYKQLVPDDFMRAVGGQYFKDLHLDEVYNTTP